MTKQLENLITKGVAIIFASLLTITGWLATNEITNMSNQVTKMASSLQEIRADVANLNTKALLQQQEFKFQFSWMTTKVTELESRVLTLEGRK